MSVLPASHCLTFFKNNRTSLSSPPSPSETVVAPRTSQLKGLVPQPPSISPSGMVMYPKWV